LHSEGNTVIFKQTTCGSFYVLMFDVYDSDMSVNTLTCLRRQIFMLIFSVCYACFVLYCIDNLCFHLAVDPLFLPPRRETSRRKAKEKTSMKQLLDRQQNLDEEFDADEPEFLGFDADEPEILGSDADEPQFLGSDADELEFQEIDEPVTLVSEAAWTSAAKVMCSLYVYYYCTCVCMF
jgi:hypothetical protein